MSSSGDVIWDALCNLTIAEAFISTRQRLLGL